VETNGGVTPEEALKEASQILIEHFKLFEEFAEHPFGVEEEAEPEELSYSLVKLDFDKRACNLLETKGITTLKDLLQKTREGLLDIHGFGRKTLEKVEERLSELGYSLLADKKGKKEDET
jgi:DNA-directed RNA polymerase subunit alpha